MAGPKLAGDEVEWVVVLGDKVISPFAVALAVDCHYQSCKEKTATHSCLDRYLLALRRSAAPRGALTLPFPLQWERGLALPRLTLYHPHPSMGLIIHAVICFESPSRACAAGEAEKTNPVEG